MPFSLAPIDTIIPTKIVEDIHIVYDGKHENVSVPLATFETPLWYSVRRGARVSQKSGGISVHIVQDSMARSIILEFENLAAAISGKLWVEQKHEQLRDLVARTSRFANLQKLTAENIGPLLYVRLSIATGDASGHNMVTKASDAVIGYMLEELPCRYVSVSGNYCVDKKTSAINGILGRGKHVAAEIIIPRDICRAMLRATPEDIVSLNQKKNMLGSILAGSIRSANAHFANIILAIYLATGQDGANVVEASQGITYASLRGEDLYFSVTIPNVIVGVVGNGKEHAFVRENLRLMGCENSSKRLAAIIGATTLCGELSLMAALTNRGELMDAHIKLERQK